MGQLGKAWDDAGKKSSVFHNLMRGASGAMGTLWMTYGQMIPMIAGFAAVGGAMKTVNSGADFDFAIRSFQDLAAGALKTTGALQLMKKEVLDMGGLTAGPGKLAEGLLEFARAGISAEEAMKGIGEVSRFAYLGEMDMAKATELVVGQLTAFKGIDTGKALNIMAVVADKTSISLNQMAEAFKNTTSLGTVLGLRFDDVAVAIGAMGQAGIRGATAGAALTTMMYKLTAPTATAEKKMRELGVSFSAIDKSTGKLKSIEQIVKDLAVATRGLTTGQQGELFESMVGIRGLKALGALVDVAKQGSEEFEKMKAQVRAVFESGGDSTSYLEERFNKLLKSGKTQIDLLKAELDKLFISSYDNSQTVAALEQLIVVLKDPDVKEGLADIVSGVVSLSTTLLSFTNTFGGVLVTGYLGKLLFGSVAEWAATAATATASVAEVALTTSTAAATAVAAATQATVTPALVSAAAATSAMATFKLTVAEVTAGIAASAAAWAPWLVAATMVGKAAKDLADDTVRGIVSASDSDAASLAIAANTFSIIPGYIGEAVENQSDLNNELKNTKGFISDISILRKGLSDEEEASVDSTISRLEKIKDQVDAMNSSPLDVIREEYAQAVRDFNAEMTLLRGKLGDSAEAQNYFNTKLSEGKKGLDRLYDGKMLKTLSSEISSMETMWDNYFLSVVSGYAEMIEKQRKLLAQKDAITQQQESTAPTGYMQPTPQNPWDSTIEGAKTLSQVYADSLQPSTAGVAESLADVNKQLDMLPGQTQSVVAEASKFKEWYAGLTEVQQLEYKVVRERIAASQELAKRNGLESYLAGVDEQKKALLSLGKAQTDLYDGTSAFSNNMYAGASEAIRAKIDAIVDETAAIVYQTNVVKFSQAVQVEAVAKAEAEIAKIKANRKDNGTDVAEVKITAEKNLLEAERLYKAGVLSYEEAEREKIKFQKEINSTSLQLKEQELQDAQALVERYAKIEADTGGSTELLEKQEQARAKLAEARTAYIEAGGKAEIEGMKLQDQLADKIEQNSTAMLTAESQLLAAKGMNYEATLKSLDAEALAISTSKDQISLRKAEIVEQKKLNAIKENKSSILQAESDLLTLKGQIYGQDELIYEGTLKQLEAESLLISSGGDRINQIRLEIIELKKQEAAVKTPWEAMQKGMKESVYSGREMAEDIQRATERAFDSMTDAIVDFVKTGKLSFSSLADSILTDLLTIMVRAGITNQVLAGMGVSTGAAAGGVGGVGTAAGGSGAAASGGMNVVGLGSLFSGSISGSLTSGLGGVAESAYMAGFGTVGDVFAGAHDWVIGMQSSLEAGLTDGLLAGVGSLTMSLLSGQGLTAQTGMQAGGSALGALLTGGSPIGAVLGGMLGSVVGGMFGTGEDTFGPQYMANDVGVNYSLTAGMKPTTKQYTGGDTDSQIAKVYAEQMRSIQNAFDDQVTALAEALPEEISTAMLNSLSAVDLKKILNNVSGQEINVADAASWLEGVAKAYSEGLIKELGKAYGTALGSFISTNGAEGLVGDTKVWGLLTEKVKENISSAFQDAAATISAGNVDEGVSNINSITSAIAQIGSAMAPITEIIETAGLTEYEKSIREINIQFDNYADALKAAGVDMSKYTDLEAARAISLSNVEAQYDESITTLEEASTAIAEILKEIADAAETDGMGEYEKQLFEVNKQFNEYAATLTKNKATIQQLTEVETARAAEISKVLAAQLEAQEETLAPVRETIATNGMSDYELSLRAVNQQFDDYRDTLIELGGTVQQLTEIEQARGVEIDKVLKARLAAQEETLAPSKEIIATNGMSEYEIQLRAVNQQFDDYRDTMSELGGTAQQLTEIEKARAIQLSKVVNPAIQESINIAKEALNKSFADAQTKLDEKHADALEGFNKQLDAANDYLSRMSSLTSALKSSLDSMSLAGQGNALAIRADNQSALSGALYAARSGDMSAAEALSENGILGDLAQSSESLFATFEDYQRDYWQTYLAMTELKTIAEASEEEAVTTVSLLEQQIKDENSWYETQKLAMTNQLNAILGVDTSVQSVEVAIIAYMKAMQGSLAAAAAAASASSLASSVGGSFAVGTDYVPTDMVANIHKGERIVPAAYNRNDATNADLVAEVKKLREEISRSGYETAKQTAKTAKLLETWEGDGMPETRTYA